MPCLWSGQKNVRLLLKLRGLLSPKKDYKEMNRKLMVLVFIFVQSLSIFGLCMAQEYKIDAKALLETKFSVPEEIADQKYLGIAEKAEFSLGQIKADLIFLEIFSMYCPVCQKDAPIVNQLFHMFESDPNLKGKVKFIGIGTGNTPYEVGVFKKKFNIKFPLLPDDDFKVQKLISQEVRTPTFVLARVKSPTQVEVLKIKVGEIKDAQEFFDSVKSVLNKGA